jgi:hypothetical protein
MASHLRETNFFFMWTQVQEPNKLTVGSVADGPRLPTTHTPTYLTDVGDPPVRLGREP